MSFKSFLAGKAIRIDSRQKLALVVLRIAIGWHFLFEGISKIFNPGWSSAGYLMDSGGVFSFFYHSAASNPSVVGVIDFLNIWGLTFIGLALMLGLLTQLATVAGIVLLLFYYLSHPPFIGAGYAMPSEGNYLFVNKTLIELITLWVLYYFPTGRIIGIDRLIYKD